MSAKYVFVTGGVVSSLGKGIISSSLAKLLQSRNLRVTIQKFDPYLNVDPGTLNPYEHGECFVTLVTTRDFSISIHPVRITSPLARFTVLS